MVFWLALSLFISASFAQSSEWYFDRAINGVEFWKHPSLKNTRIVVDTQNLGSHQPPEYYQTPVFVTELQQRKREVLKYFAIEDWQVKIEKVQRLGDDVVVDFSGSYLDASRKRVFYQERHLYGPKRLKQFLFTAENQDQLHREQLLTTFESIGKKAGQ
jgi:hypothetical protein